MPCLVRSDIRDARLRAGRLAASGGRGLDRGRVGAVHFGTVEVVTGGGKTLIALACAARVSELEPDVRIASPVPTQALARQWREALLKHTSLGRGEEVGVTGAGGRATLGRHSCAGRGS